MDFVLENEYLKVTVTSFGAQVSSVVRKCDGVEHIWQADPSVWGYHAPILYPHTGNHLVGHTLGKNTYPRISFFLCGMDITMIPQFLHRKGVYLLRLCLALLDTKHIGTLRLQPI